MQKFGKALGYTVLALVVVFGLLRVLLFKTWTVPTTLRLSASVAPTLDGGDFVLLLTRGTPGFGDLVRCKDPEDPTQYVVGRIIGVEGDKIEITGRNVEVNGKRYNPVQACRPHKYQTVHPNTEAEVDLECGVVEMGGGWHYRGQTKSKTSPMTFKAEVGEGMVYLLSDNIDLYDDSREFGTLERASCKERVVFRFVGKNGWGDEDARMTVIR
ncbi:signal peptidase I [Polyangium sp. y55x31]|uniref:signal peptidase I n=1 Tax=Polyangium sp. y55x31 TaxID=3042688 RepID=UPI002482E25B|nr:signal peptidase I [Polyangium sp. y55x31]MDI1477195.1 signal peptidase I [Polyangium sp. y55x31]